MNPEEFKTVSRQAFRDCFQPSRILLCVLAGRTPGKFNVITVCFDMYCSYKPPMMAFAVQRGAYSHELLQTAKECVLSVPGESLAHEALLCGTESGHVIDKLAKSGLRLTPSKTVSIPSLAQALANIEVRIVNRLVTGDHLVIIGEVLRFAVNTQLREKCLLSVGPDENGYRVLARKGIHRIAVVSG